MEQPCNQLSVDCPNRHFDTKSFIQGQRNKAQPAADRRQLIDDTDEIVHGFKYIYKRVVCSEYNHERLQQCH